MLFMKKQIKILEQMAYIIGLIQIYLLIVVTDDLYSSLKIFTFYHNIFTEFFMTVLK